MFKIGYARTWAFSSYLLVLVVAILIVHESPKANLGFLEAVAAFGFFPGLAALVGYFAGWNFQRGLKKGSE